MVVSLLLFKGFIFNYVFVVWHVHMREDTEANDVGFFRYVIIHVRK